MGRTNRPQRSTYVLTLVDAGVAGDAPVAARLRAVLKRLLRPWGFRRADAAELQDAAASSGAAHPRGENVIPPRRPQPSVEGGPGHGVAIPGRSAENPPADVIGDTP